MQTPWERQTYELIEQICRVETVPDKNEPVAKTIAERYFEESGSGMAPRTIAATAVRLARRGEDWPSQKEIAEIAGVSDTAMSQACPILREYAEDTSA